MYGRHLSMVNGSRRFASSTPLSRKASTSPTTQASVGLESGEYATLQFFDFSNARTRTLAHLERPISIGLAVSRDGRTVLYTQIDDVAGDLMMVENFR